MKQAFTLMALLLALALMYGGPVSAVILPDIDGPRLGGGDVDDDHPWGGDRLPDDTKDSLDKYTRSSSVTGQTFIDILYYRLLDELLYQLRISSPRTITVEKKDSITYSKNLSRKVQR